MTTKTWVSLLLAISARAYAQDAGVEKLAWLAGCWEINSSKAVIEEHWSKPSGLSMLGFSRTVRGGKTTETEYLRIDEKDGGVVYTASPSGQATTSFKAVKVSDSEVVFENAQHDFPQRILYRKQANGDVNARIEGTRNGQTRGIDFPFKKVACP